MGDSRPTISRVLEFSRVLEPPYDSVFGGVTDVANKAF
jgi:hypothetical protein